MQDMKTNTKTLVPELLHKMDAYPTSIHRLT
jgi:hypothetical protein